MSSHSQRGFSRYLIVIKEFNAGARRHLLERVTGIDPALPRFGTDLITTKPFKVVILKIPPTAVGGWFRSFLRNLSWSSF